MDGAYSVNLSDRVVKRNRCCSFARFGVTLFSAAALGALAACSAQNASAALGAKKAAVQATSRVAATRDSTSSPSHNSARVSRADTLARSFAHAFASDVELLRHDVALADPGDP